MSLISLEICYWITVCYDLLWISLMVHHVRLYWQHRWRLFLKRRLPLVTLGTLICSIFILIQRSFDGLVALGYINDIWEITTLIVFVEFFPYFGLLFYKFWITFYHYRYNEAVADYGWKILLILGKQDKIRTFSRWRGQETTEEGESIVSKNWVFKLKTTLGNPPWMAKFTTIVFGILPTVLVAGMLCRARYFGPQNDDKRQSMKEMSRWIGILTGFSYILLIILTFVYLVIFQINRFTDSLKIKYELNLITTVAVIEEIFIMVYAVLFFRSVSVNVTRIVYFIQLSIVLSIIEFIMISLMLLQLNKQLVLQNKETIPLFCNYCWCSKGIITISKGEIKTNDKMLANGGININAAAINVSVSVTDRRLKLNDVISHEMGYRLFMRHLVTEWSIENLLFITEVTQYRKSNIFTRLRVNGSQAQKEEEEVKVDDDSDDNNNKNANNDNDARSVKDYIRDITENASPSSSEKDGMYPKLPNNIPKSNIMKSKNIFDKIRLIMDRYVVDDAKLQINISSHERNSLLTNFDHITKNISTKYDDSTPQAVSNDDLIYLQSLFDNGCQEIFYLLRSSFKNFVRTESFVQFQAKF